MHNRYIKYFVFLLFTADLVLSAIFLKNDHRDIEKIFSLPALSKVAGQPGYIALTFDDGPDRKCTPLLLDGLKERGVHATFFLMGSNIEGKEDIVKRMSEEGHLIGIQPIKELRESGYKKVTLSAKEAIPRDFFNLSGIANYAETADKTSVSFMYNGNITAIIDKLHLLHLDDVLLEEPSLEEIFMHYYE